MWVSRSRWEEMREQVRRLELKLWELENRSLVAVNDEGLLYPTNGGVHVTEALNQLAKHSSFAWRYRHQRPAYLEGHPLGKRGAE